MAAIRLENLVKAFGKVEVVHGIDLAIADGEFVVLVGPSGCGKTTTLRMIAGLEDITGGSIYIGDQRVNDLPPKKRNIAMVFQSYALYPHMSVADNMAFGLKLKGLSRAVIAERIADASTILGLDGLLERKPRDLSGGQRQRVAMGRAMVRDPQAFLFDEPLSNLDAKLRGHMRTEIKRLHQRLESTIVYVTHDQIEAMTLADRIVVMNDGKIEQVGPPQQMYEAPATRFVAGFIGSPAMNFVDCRLEAHDDTLMLAIEPDIRLAVPAEFRDRYGPYAGRAMILGIRPEHLSLQRDDGSDAATLPVTVDVTEPLGMETLVFFRIANGTELCARLPPRAAPQPGTAADLVVALEHMHLIDPDSDRVI